MPKTKRLHTPEPRAWERPSPLEPYIPVPLTETERVEFRKIIANPVFKKVMYNAWASRPGVNVPETGVHIKDVQKSLMCTNNRFHQIQGWEAFETAVFIQAEAQVRLTKPNLVETYKQT